MSQCWGFYCETCKQKATLVQWNHGGAELIRIRDLLPVIAKLGPCRDILTLLFRGGWEIHEQTDGLIMYAQIHSTHDVRVRAEDGNERCELAPWIEEELQRASTDR
jgi:hypothetical protein